MTESQDISRIRRQDDAHSAVSSILPQPVTKCLSTGDIALLEGLR
jgi:hypothetical protein